MAGVIDFATPAQRSTGSELIDRFEVVADQLNDTKLLVDATRRLNHSLLDDKEHTTEKQREVACEMTRLTEEAINRVCDAFEYLQLEMVNRFAPFEDDQPPAA